MRSWTALKFVELSAALLVAALLMPTAAQAGDGDDPGAVLDTQTATLVPAENRVGTPTDPDPGRQLASASVESDLHPDDTRDWLRTNVTLAGFPQPNPTEYDDNARLVAGYGHFAGTNCQIGAVSVELTSAGAQSYEMLDWVGEDGYGKIGERPATPFDCVAVILESLDGTVTYDAMVGGFTNHYLSPRIATGSITLLGQTQKRLKLVKGVWTDYVLTVSNTGDYKVDSVTLTGAGKGLKVRGDLDDFGVAPGESTSVTVRVKLTGKLRKTRLRLTTDAGNGVLATAKFRVKRVAPPRPPKSGNYRSKSGDVQFSIRKGKVTGFSITTTTRCGTYLNPSSTTNTYDFPTTKIPRNGILNASQKGTTSGPGEWTASLSFKMVGSKVSLAHFGYYFYQPGVIGSNCSAGEGFKVRRRG